MIYFTSDQHFNHSNILTFEPETRPFKTIEEMNQVLVDNWNSKVTNADEVYVLGDFFLGQADKITEWLYKLHGRITLIRGNHDTKAKIDYYTRNGITVKDIDFVSYKGNYFILCHFPIISEDFVQLIGDRNNEVVSLYGHYHSNAPKGYYNKSFHIGVDTNDLTPISIEEIWRQCPHT